MNHSNTFSIENTYVCNHILLAQSYTQPLLPDVFIPKSVRV